MVPLARRFYRGIRPHLRSISPGSARRRPSTADWRCMWITDRVDGELSVALAEVRRFASRRVAPQTERHERPIDAVALSQLLAEADGLGLASAGGGLWAESGGVVASVALLSTVAEHSAGVALAIHQRALAARVAPLAAVEGVDLVAAHGHYGVGRAALADWLAGDPSAESQALLADVYAAERSRVVTAAAAPEALLMPIWQRDLELWVVAPEVVALPRAHGLDELATFQVSARGTVKARVEGARARAAFLLALRAEALASVVVGAAAVRRGTRMARQFAEQRQQGGAPIAEHPAVSALLSVASVVLSGVAAEVVLHAALPTTEASAISALSLAAAAHPRLADAANAALQVFGGLGYMRDTGLEKIVRDQNHLRRYLASPAELSAVAARWERIHG